MSSISYDTYRNDFRQLEKLGKGNSASVYRIQKKRSNGNPYEKEFYALKLINLSDVNQIPLNLNELEIIRSLRGNIHVPEIYHYFITYTKNYQAPIQIGIIMQLCSRSLKDQLYERHLNSQRLINGQKYKYSQFQIIEFIRQMSSILSRMQKEKILHRDIKPQNILISYVNGQKIYKLADFGYSIFQNQYSARSITGTACYASPRIKRKFDNQNITIDGINYRDDAYSFGKVILEMIQLHNIHNQQINKQLLCHLKLIYGRTIIKILQNLLNPYQQFRWDFIYLNNRIQQMIVDTNINVQNNQNNQNNLLSSSTIRPIPETKKSVQVQAINVDQEPTQNKKNIQINLDKIFQVVKEKIKITQSKIYFNESNQYCQNVLNINKPIRNNHQENTVYQEQQHIQSISEIKGIFNQTFLKIDQKIFSVNRVFDYLIMGMNKKIAILNLSDMNKVYFMDLLQQKNKLSNIVMKILVTNDNIILVTTGNYLHGVNLHRFKQQIQKIENNTSSQKQIKVPNIHKRFLRQNPDIKYYYYDYFMFGDIYHKQTIRAFDGIFNHNTQQNNPQNNPQDQNKQQQTILMFGDNNGYIRYKDLKNDLSQQFQNQPIIFIKTNQKYFFYQTGNKNIKVYSRQSTLVNGQIKITYHKYGQIPDFNQFITQAQIKYPSTSQNNNNNENQQNSHEFIKIFSLNGNLYLYDSNLNLIKKTNTVEKDQLAYIQINKQWNFNKDKNQICVRQKAKKVIYTLDNQGVIHNLSKQQKVYETGIIGANSLFIDSHLIIVCGVYGQIKIIFYDEEEYQQRKLIIQNQKIINQKRINNEYYDSIVKKICQFIIQYVKKELSINHGIQTTNIINQNNVNNNKNSLLLTTILNNQSPYHNVNIKMMRRNNYSPPIYDARN